MKPNRTSPARAPGVTSAPHVDPAPTAELPTDRRSSKTITSEQLDVGDMGEPGVDYAIPGSDPSDVEKVVVETTGDFMLRDPWTGSVIPHDGPSEPIVRSTFIDNALEDGRLKIV